MSWVKTTISIAEESVAAQDVGGGRYRLLEDVSRYFRRGDVCVWRQGRGWAVIMRLVVAPDEQEKTSSASTSQESSTQSSDSEPR